MKKQFSDGHIHNLVGRPEGRVIRGGLKLADEAENRACKMTNHVTCQT